MPFGKSPTAAESSGSNPGTNPSAAVKQSTEETTRGGLDPGSSVILVSSDSLASGDTITVTLIPKDTRGQTLKDLDSFGVHFSNSGGSSTGTWGVTEKTKEGNLAAKFTGAKAGTLTTVTASVHGAQIRGGQPVTVTSGVYSGSASKLSLSSPTVVSGSDVVVTLTLKDAAGNSNPSGFSGNLRDIRFQNSWVGGDGVFGVTKDLGNGVYSTTFTPGRSGAVSIRAGIFSSSSSPLIAAGTPQPLTVSPGPASLLTSSLSVTAGAIASGTSLTAVLTLRDAAGNLNPKTSAPPLITYKPDTGTASLSQTSGKGPFSATLAGQLVGSVRISAQIDGQEIAGGNQIIQITVGQVSLAASTISVTSSTVASGGEITATLIAKDAAGNLGPTGILQPAPTFTYTAGTGTASLSRSEGGAYTASLKGILIGTVTLGAKINGVEILNSQKITVTPGPFSLSKSVLSVSASTLFSGSSVTATLTPKDEVGNPNPTGITIPVISVAAESGSASVGPTEGKDPYTAVVTGVLAGSVKVSATINGAQLASGAQTTVVVHPGTYSLSTSSITVSATNIVSGSSVTATLTPKDAAGNLNPTGINQPLLIATPGTGSGSIGTVSFSGGRYNAPLTGILAGTVSITASVGGKPVTSSSAVVTVSAGTFSLSKSTLSLSASTVVSGSSVTVFLTPRDAAGNLGPSGVTSPEIIYTPGTGTASIGKTSSDGRATLTGSRAGTVTVGATINGGTVTGGNQTVTVTAGPVSLAASTLSVSSSKVVSGSTVTVTLTPKDAAGNLNPSGVTAPLITYTPETGTGVLTATSDGAAPYTATLTGVLAGTVSLGATIGGSPITSRKETVNVSVGAMSLASSTLSVSASSVTSGSSITAIFTPRDAAGNLNPTGVGQPLLTCKNGTGTAILGETKAINGGYGATLTGVLTGTVIVGGKLGEHLIKSGDQTVTVTVGPVSLAKSSISISAGTVASGQSVTATLTPRDAAGNPGPTGVTSPLLTYSSGTGTASLSATSGSGPYTATLTGLRVGTVSVGATIGEKPVTGVNPTVTVTVGAYSLSESTLSVSSSTVVSGSTVVVTLTPKDAAGNLGATGIATPLVVISGGAAGATGTALIGPTSGKGPFVATITGVLAGPVSVGATINGGKVTSSSPKLTVTPGHVDPALSVISVSSQTVGVGSSLTVTLIPKDRAGNPNASGVSSARLISIAGSGKASLGPTTGTGPYAAELTGIGVGTVTLGASINDKPVTSGNQVVTVSAPLPHESSKAGGKTGG